MSKKLIFAALLLTLLFSFGTVFADQDGRNCWCNIDEYGCWVTEDDGGQTYLMFWSETARRYIMGTGSAPYKFVVAHPGYTGFLELECGNVIPARTIVASADDPTQDSDPDSGDKCKERKSYCETFTKGACIAAAFSESECNDPTYTPAASFIENTMAQCMADEGC